LFWCEERKRIKDYEDEDEETKRKKKKKKEGRDVSDNKMGHDARNRVRSLFVKTLHLINNHTHLD